MQVKSLIWELVDNKHCLWRGKTDGWSCHAFFITRINTVLDEYLVHTDINGIANETCIGIENAKAQELLNNYALGLIIL